MPNLPWTSNTIFQMSLLGTSFGQQVVNVHHFQASDVLEPTLTTDALAQAAGTALAGAWLATQRGLWINAHGTDYGISLVRVQVLERPLLWRHRLTPTDTSTGGSFAGTVSPPAEDPETCAVIKWRTPQSGKHYRGRTYVGPLPTAWIADGLVLGAALTVIGNYAASMVSDYGGSATPGPAYRLVIYSRPFNHGEYSYTSGKNPNKEVIMPPDSAGFATRVTAQALDPVVRSQRRRQIGRGS